MSLLTLVIVTISFTYRNKSLRDIYSRPPSEWPAPMVDAGIKWKEIGTLPASPLENLKDSLRHLINLGKVLFFDKRLSGSGKIACATCHQPEMHWTDNKNLSVGHGGARNKRNAPTIQNVWFYQRLFWDGRSSGLEDQAFAPINSESEMHNDMRTLPRALREIKGYPELFKAAYGDPSIDPDRIANAIAIFQRTIVSAPSRFDKFLAGDKKILSKNELTGLHLFRTKGRCMNCHNGPLFSDNMFHQNGFSAGDKGLYQVTHKEEDMGKIKTPSLRDVAYTGPWMHSGQMDNLATIISMYNDFKFPSHENLDKSIKPLGLTFKEEQQLMAFLYAISGPSLPFPIPQLP